MLSRSPSDKTLEVFHSTRNQWESDQRVSDVVPGRGGSLGAAPNVPGPRRQSLP